MINKQAFVILISMSVLLILNLSAKAETRPPLNVPHTVYQRFEPGMHSEFSRHYDPRRRAVDSALDQFDHGADQTGSPSYQKFMKTLETVDQTKSQLPAEKRAVNRDSADAELDFQDAPAPGREAADVRPGPAVLPKHARSAASSLPREGEVFESDLDAQKATLAERYLDFSNPRNTLSVGVEAFDYSYREPGLMKDDGEMYGAFFEYEHRSRINPEVTSWQDVLDYRRMNMFKIDGRFSRGSSIKYRSEGTGEYEGEKARVYETRALIGFDCPYQGQLFTPYAGLGYRFLEDYDGRHQTTTGHWSYNRDQMYLYVPFGVDYETNLNKKYSIGANLEYDTLIRGENNTYVKGLGGYLQDAQHEQHRGHGYRGSVALFRHFDNWDFFFEPYFRIWHIERSDDITWSVVGNDTVQIKTYEPDNRTQEYGAKMGVRF
ncbi:MAG: hypothetical protein ACLFPX_07085 [Candidatus Omnitrophota bacterium]